MSFGAPTEPQTPPTGVARRHALVVEPGWSMQGNRWDPQGAQKGFYEGKHRRFLVTRLLLLQNGR